MKITLTASRHAPAEQDTGDWGIKQPRAPRRRQTEVDDARHQANLLRAELREVRAERARYREALKEIATRIPPSEEDEPGAYTKWRIAYDALRARG